MWVYGSVFACVCVRVSVCLLVYVCACVCVRTRKCRSVRVHVGRVCIRVCGRMCAYARLCVWANVCAYLHICLLCSHARECLWMCSCEYTRACSYVRMCWCVLVCVYVRVPAYMCVRICVRELLDRKNQMLYIVTNIIYGQLILYNYVELGQRSSKQAIPTINDSTFQRVQVKRRLLKCKKRTTCKTIERIHFGKPCPKRARLLSLCRLVNYAIT